MPSSRRSSGAAEPLWRCTSLLIVADHLPGNPARCVGEMPARRLPKFGKIRIVSLMSTMNVSLPEQMKRYIDEQVEQRGYSTSSEYVRELIRKDQDRQRLRGLLLDGARSKPGDQADKAYFDSLRERVKRRHREA